MGYFDENGNSQSVSLIESSTYCDRKRKPSLIIMELQKHLRVLLQLLYVLLMVFCFTSVPRRNGPLTFPKNFPGTPPFNPHGRRH